ncbi:hypothetical protein AB0J35_50840 [Nonomuraea angiospora]
MDVIKQAAALKERLVNFALASQFARELTKPSSGATPTTSPTAR